jgi:hypothetical protein
MAKTLVSGGPTRRPQLLLYTVLIVYAVGSGFACADETLSSVVMKLAELKDRVEGRASRVQSCLHSKGNAKLASALEAEYGDNRAKYNAWIDGTIAAINAHRDKIQEVPFDIGKLNYAERKVKEFVDHADAVLAKNKCPVAYKINWATEIAGAVLGPQIIEWIKHVIGTEGDNGATKIISTLEAKKIAAWNEVSVVAVYDWKNNKLYNAPSKINAALIDKGGNTLYVNKWALKRMPNEALIPNKEMPPDLSSAYKVFLGSKSTLDAYINDPVANN